ncbi:PAS domain S-box protein [Geomonas sp. RF6]|uniref:methyl-accepting chemotaxis protein n=1 Tax=Geomonas sp. RF6 TaxID=2897342 RepID=UPI001E5FC124|nr:PAS domain S-box protein [Geomonas sp. RF6]UFS69445.1 PAS domain S-box protein [Geomonas sp. RF6]
MPSIRIFGRGSSKEHDGLFEALFEGGPDATVVLNGEGRIILVNAQCERLFGYDRSELVGREIEMLVGEASREIHLAQRARFAADPSSSPMAAARAGGAVRKDGSRLQVQISLAFVRSSGAELLVVAIRDVTAQQRQIEQLIGVLKGLPDPVFTLTPEGRITHLNEAAVQATGIPRSSLVDSLFSECFTEKEKAVTFQRDLVATGKVNDFPLSFERLYGGATEVLVSGTVLRDAEGQAVGAVVAARDVTTANALTAQLAEAKKYLDNILQSSTKYSIVGIDLDCRIISWNEGGHRNYGYSAEEVVGKDMRLLHTPEDRASGAVDRLLKRAWEKGVAEGEFTRLRKDGSHFEASVVVTRRDDLAGRPIGYLLMSSDITDRKTAEEKVRQAALYARSLVEASLDPLVTISTEGKVTDVNEAMIKATGMSREELVGSDFTLHFTEPRLAQEGYRRVFSDGHLTDYPLTIRHRNGTRTEVLYNASVYRDLSGNVLGALAAARDVTRRKRLDEELEEAANILAAASSEIMATMAQVAAGARETAATVSETTAVAEQVKVAAYSSRSKAQTVRDVAQKAVSMAQRGRRLVDDSVTGMGRIQEEMASIARTVTGLSGQSEIIGEIIETVKDLAEQSNLLAVNAAIEAAKAGELGKGFDVVAREVKSLAAESKKATAQVRDILNDIQKATKAAVLAAEQGRLGVEAGVRQTSDAGEVIRHMAESIEDSAETAAEIASSSQEHVTGMDQISSAMDNIKQASEQNVSGLRQVEETLHNLHALGQKLKQLVEQY